MNDLHLYRRVAEELRLSGPEPGLWAKAFAESRGEKARAEAAYLRYRVAQLAEAENQAAQTLEREMQEAQRTDAAREEQDRSERAKAEGLTPIHWLLIGLPAFFILLFALKAAGLLR